MSGKPATTRVCRVGARRVQWRRCPRSPTPRSRRRSPRCRAGRARATRSSRSSTAASFPAAIAFVVQVGFLAEKADHHPDIDIRWKQVRIALTTHSANGLTNLDLDLAGEIEAIGA